MFRHASPPSLAFSGAGAVRLWASGPSTNRCSGPLFFAVSIGTLSICLVLCFEPSDSFFSDTVSFSPVNEQGW